MCDDHALMLESTAQAVAEILQGEHMAHTIAKFTSGRQLLNAAPFDILLLDIQMEPISGLETARLLRVRGDRSAIIFLTAHNQYVFSAFDVEAAHYLIKPLDSIKLREILVRVTAKLASDNQPFLVVRQASNLHRILISDIGYIEVLGRKISLHTNSGIFDFNGRLEQLEASLPPSFFRCHRSFIVNLAQVHQCGKSDVVLANGTHVPVSKRKSQVLGTAFLHFLQQEEAHS